jgi:hypothetical protein
VLQVHKVFKEFKVYQVQLVQLALQVFKEMLAQQGLQVQLVQ